MVELSRNQPNQMKLVKKYIKHLIFGEGRKPRRIPCGLYRGLTLSIDAGQESLFYFGLYEAETNPWLRRLARNAKTFIDVGAGCGELTAWALRIVGMEKVLSYDVSSSRWPIFSENMRLNGFDADPRLTRVQDFFPSGDQVAVADALFADLPEPIFMKIDVDGGEGAILNCMRDILVRKRLSLLVETHSKQLDEECFEILVKAGYNCRRIEFAWWRCIFPEQRPEAFNQWIAAWRD